MTSIEKIQLKIDCLGEKINAPKKLLLILTSASDDGVPYVKLEEDGFSYISSERGYETFKKLTKSLDELLYWIMSRVTRQIANEFELNNRSTKEDTRKQHFKK